MNIRYRRDLYKLLPNIGQAVCAELGCAEGFFAAEMAAWGIRRLYVVDMWEHNPRFPGDAGNDQDWHNKNYEDAKKRFEKFAHTIEILRGDTVRMAQMVPDRSLDLVNVDACHTKECVSADIAAWWPKLKMGGIMAFHDFEAKQYGVKKAVQEFVAIHKMELNLLPEDKEEDAGAWIRK